jgi:hypothetical protein
MMAPLYVIDIDLDSRNEWCNFTGERGDLIAEFIATLCFEANLQLVDASGGSFKNSLSN